jgi:hypothetical protein
MWRQLHFPLLTAVAPHGDKACKYSMHIVLFIKLRMTA